MAKRTFKSPGYDWVMDMQDLQKITEEVYGVPYDIQMGERGQGEYDVATTEAFQDREGYHTGLGQGRNYEDKYPEGHGYFYFDEDQIDPATGDYVDTVDKAIAKFMSQTPQETPWGKDWGRPFDKVGDNGEYTFWQPSLETILTDLARKDEIPHGTYMVQIDW